MTHSSESYWYSDIELDKYKPNYNYNYNYNQSLFPLSEIRNMDQMTKWRHNILSGNGFGGCRRKSLAQIHNII